MLPMYCRFSVVSEVFENRVSEAKEAEKMKSPAYNADLRVR